jgi:hypothetical protein
MSLRRATRPKGIVWYERALCSPVSIQNRTGNAGREVIKFVQKTRNKTKAERIDLDRRYRLSPHFQIVKSAYVRLRTLAISSLKCFGRHTMASVGVFGLQIIWRTIPILPQSSLPTTRDKARRGWKWNPADTFHIQKGFRRTPLPPGLDLARNRGPAR